MPTTILLLLDDPQRSELPAHCASVVSESLEPGAEILVRGYDAARVDDPVAGMILEAWEEITLPELYPNISTPMLVVARKRGYGDGVVVPPVWQRAGLGQVEGDLVVVEIDRHSGGDPVRAWLLDLLASAGRFAPDSYLDAKIASATEIQTVERFVYEIRIALDIDTHLPRETVAEIDNLVDLAATHLRSPRPRRSVLRAILSEIHSFSLGVATGVVGNAVFANPAVQQWFQRAFESLGRHL